MVKSGHFASPQAAQLGSHLTACLACSHKTESFSGGENYLWRGFLMFFSFLARALSAVVAPLPTSRLLDNVKVRDQVSHPLRRDSGRSSNRNRHLSRSVNTSRLPGPNLVMA